MCTPMCCSVAVMICIQVYTHKAAVWILSSHASQAESDSQRRRLSAYCMQPAVMMCQTRQSSMHLQQTDDSAIVMPEPCCVPQSLNDTWRKRLRCVVQGREGGCRSTERGVKTGEWMLCTAVRYTVVTAAWQRPLGERGEIESEVKKKSKMMIRESMTS